MKIRKILLLAGTVMAMVLPARAQEVLKIGLRPVPPYVMTTADGRYFGLEYDLIAEALRRSDIQFEVRLYPLSRLIYAYDGVQEVDAAAPVTSRFNVGGRLSGAYIRYQNVAISLAAQPLALTRVQDLAGLRVMAFQNSRQVLGPEYAAAVAQGQFTEQANQELQMVNLLSGRTDVIIGDRRIFQYLYGTLNRGGAPYGAVIREHVLFPPTDYSVAFRSAAQAEKFDAALAEMRKDGTEKQIFQRYDTLVPVSN